MSWDTAFDEPVELPNGKTARTLRNAGEYIAQTAEAEHEQKAWQTAMHCLIEAAEKRGPISFARMGPYATQKQIADPGVALYFMLKKRPMVMAMDRYTSVAGNMRSLTLAIEAMRQLERHGGETMMERVFTGFAALAHPDRKKPWREVFSVQPGWRGDIKALYREKAKNRHPDSGGSDTLMAELNVAYTEAQQELGERAA